MKANETKKLFFRFLKDNNIYNEFFTAFNDKKNNYILSRKEINNFIETKSKFDLILDAFQWSCYKQLLKNKKFKTWAIVHEEWISFFKNKGLKYLVV